MEEFPIIKKAPEAGVSLHKDNDLQFGNVDLDAPYSVIFLQFVFGSG